MKQLGNLAIVCAKRKDVRVVIENGRVSVYVLNDKVPAVFNTGWDDEEAINKIIYELNFGVCA